MSQALPDESLSDGEVAESSADDQVGRSTADGLQYESDDDKDEVFAIEVDDDDGAVGPTAAGISEPGDDEETLEVMLDNELSLMESQTKRRKVNADYTHHGPSPLNRHALESDDDYWQNGPTPKDPNRLSAIVNVHGTPTDGDPDCLVPFGPYTEWLDARARGELYANDDDSSDVTSSSNECSAF
jgi:hypothetical protein